MKLFKTVLVALILSLNGYAFANSFKTTKWVTSNGVPVVFYQAMEVPMLDVSIAFAAGSAYDGNRYGLSALTTQMLNQGNGGKDANAIAETFADNGTQFDAETSRDMVVLNLRSLTKKQALEPSISMLKQIISHPDFPNNSFDNEKRQLLMAIEQNDESPDDIANINFFKALYKQHPYAHPVNGTTNTVKALNKQQVIDFYKKYYVSSNAVLVLVGAIEDSKAKQIAEELTHDLPQGKRAQNISKAAQLTKAEQINIPFPSSQTIIRLGQIGINHQNSNYIPLMVGNYILGEGALVSRLAVEVREKRGLTYGINSQFAPMPGNGPFIIGFSTKREQTATALKITKNTLESFIKDGPTQQELDAAKHYLTGSFPLSLASNRSIASLLLRMAFYHLPDDYLETYLAKINAVTIDEIKRAFKQQVNPNTMLQITVGGM